MLCFVIDTLHNKVCLNASNKTRQLPGKKKTHAEKATELLIKRKQSDNAPFLPQSPWPVGT